MASDGTLALIYDSLNRMIRVEKQGVTVAAYGYDSSNRRNERPSEPPPPIISMIWTDKRVITNSPVHVTTYSSYSAFGQAETVADPNGIVTSRAALSEAVFWFPQPPRGLPLHIPDRCRTLPCQVTA